MFYLNRGGAPEGPFDEARIVQMIRSGELTQGGVCPVGQNQWWPLHPVRLTGWENFFTGIAARWRRRLSLSWRSSWGLPVYL